MVKSNYFTRENKLGSSHCCSEVTNPTSIREDTSSVPDLTQWVGHRYCSELWYGSQTRFLWLSFRLIVSSNLTPGLETSVCHGCSSKKRRKKKKGREREKVVYMLKTIIWVNLPLNCFNNRNMNPLLCVLFMHSWYVLLVRIH